MGTFGYGPLDNDCAMDMMGEMMLPIVKEVDRVLLAATNEDWQVTRCACWWIEMLGLREGEWAFLDKYEDAGEDTLEVHRALGIARLTALLSDGVHLSRFTDPDEYVAEVQAQIKRLAEHDTNTGTGMQALEKAMTLVKRLQGRPFEGDAEGSTA